MRLYVFDPLIINACSLRIELIYNDSSLISWGGKKHGHFAGKKKTHYHGLHKAQASTKK